MRQRSLTQFIYFLFFLIIAATAIGCDRCLGAPEATSETPTARSERRSSPPMEYDAVSAIERVATGSSKAISVAEQKKSLVEQQRLQAIETELQSVDVRTVSHSLEPGTPQESFVKAMAQAAQAIDDIYQLQVHGNNLIWKTQLHSTGESVERRLHFLYGEPWCRISTESTCNAIATRPKRNTGTLFWPNDFTSAEFDKISTYINSQELLSPFGLVTRDKRRLRVQPYAEHSRFRELFERLSAIFKEAAAEKGIAKEISPLLTRLSENVATADIFTMGIDRDLLEGKADEWRIQLGASDAGLDRFGVKQAFDFRLSKIYSPANGLLAWFSAHHEEFVTVVLSECSNSSEVAMDGSTPPPIEVLDTWIASGVSRYTNVPVVRHIQNAEIPPQRYNIVSLHQAIAQTEDDMQALRSVIPNEVFGVDATIENILARELGVSLLPTLETTVTLENGKQFTLSRLLKRRWDDFQPLLARISAAWILVKERETNRIDDETLKERGLALVARWIQESQTGTEAEKKAARVLLSLRVGDGILPGTDANVGYVFLSQSFFAGMQSLFNRWIKTILSGDSEQVEQLWAEMLTSLNTRMAQRLWNVVNQKLENTNAATAIPAKQRIFVYELESDL